MPFVAKIKLGHVVIRLTYQLNLDDDYTLLADEIVDAEIVVKSNIMTEFLDGCIGEYKFNANDYTISFADNRDYVKYSLIIEDTYQVL